MDGALERRRGLVYGTPSDLQSRFKLSPRVAKLFPYKSHFFKTNDQQWMHVIDEGQMSPADEQEFGQAIVCLHGNPTWGFYFRSLVERFAPKARIIVPDHIGCGLSDHPTDKHYRATHRAEHVQQLLQALGITKYSLVLHDWGGPIGTNLALRNVDAVKKIVYFNTTLTETESLPYIIKRAAHPLVGRFFTRTTAHFVKLTTTLGVEKRLPKEIKEGYLSPYGSRARRTAIWDFVADIPFDNESPSYYDMLELAVRLPQLRQKPVLIIWGLKDPCFHRGIFGHMTKHFAHAQTVELPTASHLVLEDEPEICGRAIETFLWEGAAANSTVIQLPAVGRQAPLYQRFAACATAQPSASAVVEPQTWLYSIFGAAISYSQITRGQLLSRIHQYERALTEFGLKPGDKVVMLVPPGVDFLALTFAIQGRGAVPVFLDPGMGRQNLISAIREVAPQGFIGSWKAMLLRRWLKPTFAQLKFAVTTAPMVLVGNTVPLNFLRRFSDAPLPQAACPNEVSLIAYTSGGTGAPKGVPYTHTMVEATLKIFEEQFGLRAPGVDLSLLPAFSIFSSALGLTSVRAPINPSSPLALDPKLVCQVLDDQGVTSSFGSPTLWNKIAEYCVRSQQELHSLRQVFMAGAPVADGTLRMVSEIAPNAVVGTPYGATESLPVTWVDAEQRIRHQGFQAVTGEEGTYVGKPVQGVEVAVIPISQGRVLGVQPLEAGVIGEIVVTGNNVSAGYLARPEADALSKIVDGERIWHRMGDVGYLDTEGGLYFCGRKVHCVNHGDALMYPIPVERVFNAHADVRRSALVQLVKPNRAGLVVEPFPGRFPTTEEQRKRFVEELLELGRQRAVSASIVDVFFHQAFPVDARHNAKIFRDKLSQWAQQQQVR